MFSRFTGFSTGKPCRRRWLLPLLVWATTEGCTSLGPDMQGTRLHPEDIHALSFTLDRTSATDSAAAATDITQTVTSRLAESGFPMSTTGMDPRLSHRLVGTIGAVSHQSTPTGLSLSLGDSDPRALEFQKADVIPIDCQLSSQNPPIASARLHMNMPDARRISAVQAPESQAEKNRRLAEQVAMVCFNLLEELNVRKQPHATPTWEPELQIKTRGEPAQAPARQPTPVVPTSPPQTATGTQKQPAIPMESPTPAQEAIPSSSTQPHNAPVVEIEQRADPTGDHRPQMIIRNRGNPVILEFGYERK